MILLYQKIGFNGAIRSDHVPTMAGESNEHFGYEMKGNLFGIGYIKGLMEAANM
jgi:mannonate dehydratase